MKSRRTESDEGHAEDVRWCLENKEELKFTVFADHFALTDKQFAYNSFSRILKKYINDKNLEESFKLWKKSELVDKYWAEKIHSSKVRKSSWRAAAQHIEESKIDEHAQFQNYFEIESSLSDSTSDDSDYTASAKSSVYRPTFDELNDNSLKTSASTCTLRKRQQTFQKRIWLSSITLPSVDKTFMLKKWTLSDECYLMILLLKRPVEAKTSSIPVRQSSDSFWSLLYSILTYTSNTIKIGKRYALRISTRTRSLNRTSSPIFRWDIYSKAYDESRKKKRPDFIICTSDGFEVGCGEIKLPKTACNEEEEDRCRVPEHLKKQLHMRLKVASEEKELVTYGILILSKKLQLSMMEFKEGKYEYSVIKRLQLPTMESTYQYMMDESVEYLLGFFDTIRSTIVARNGSSSNFTLFDQHKKNLKPTISFE
ncbi:hypothetical protein [Parasitella parasitica]|uniref:Uncharacterized protein n=1 Tax=Parasitella parasitica TaxID=35722 RepID=A0A0B7N8L5_9FUNG|nr:hypothetical protein [Parasitella parasitica]